MTTSPRKLPALCAAILFLCISALSCNKSGPVTTTVELPPPPPIMNPCDARAELSWDTLKMLIAEKGKIIMDIYPVKYSSDSSSCKTDLAIYLRGPEGSHIPQPGDLPQEKFEDAAKNFVALLKTKHVLREDVTLGYQMSLDESSQTTLKHIILTYQLHRSQLQYPGGFPRYDTCRVPPDCRMSMLQAPAMQAAIDEVYGDDEK